MASAPVPSGRGDFHIAILCALPCEAQHVMYALDHTWKDKRYDPPPGDDSAYTLGTIGEHNVVIVHMSGVGITQAASAASILNSSYPRVKLTLVVGICGGMPTVGEGEEILLGDVMISKALIQYDFKKQYPGRDIRNIDVLSALSAPNKKILGILQKLEARQHKEVLQSGTVRCLQDIQQESSEAKYPGLDHDILYNSSYTHRHRQPGQCQICEGTDDVCEAAIETNCEDLGCESSAHVSRQRLLEPSQIKPVIHIGRMGCANTVMKSGQDRDNLARKEKIIAVEMEGAGVWIHGPTIVIKGVSDYADSHKRKNWQHYAAATAAACTKAFLLEWWAPEKGDNNSDLANAYMTAPKRSKLNQSTDRVESQSMEQFLSIFVQQASRRKSGPLEQLESGSGQPVRPYERSTDYSYDEPVGAYNRKQITNVPSENRLDLNDYLKSLDFKQMNDRKRTIHTHTEGTCEWLLTLPDYQKWTQEKGLFLVRGIPGCGKSTLIKYTLAQQQARAAEDNVKELNISFFFDAGGTELGCMHGMLRSLLWHLVREDKGLEESFCELCHRIFNPRVGTKGDLAWDTHDLRTTFDALLRKTSVGHSVKIFIDAIDECREQDQADLTSFFHSLRKVAQARPGKVGIFITSREFPNMLVKSDFEILLQEQNQKDIRSFLTDELYFLDETQEDRDDLETFLQDQANGSFLWLTLIFPLIKDMSRAGANLPRIKSKVSQFPRSNELYSTRLKKIDESESDETNALFQWTCFAVRPLSIGELRMALTIHVSKGASSIKEYIRKDSLVYSPSLKKLRDRVIHLSQGLISFPSTDPADESTLVRFWHGSTKAFMHEKGLEMIQPKPQNALSPTQAASAELTNTCLRFLSAKEVHEAMLDRDIDILSQHAFFSYARDHWTKHAAEAEKNGTADSVDWSLYGVLPAWIHIERHRDNGIPGQCKEGTAPIHIAARYGLVSLANKLLDNYSTDEVSETLSATDLNERSRPQTPSNSSESQSPISARNQVSFETEHKSSTSSLQGVKPRSPSSSSINVDPKISLPVAKKQQLLDAIDVQDVGGATPFMLAAGAGQPTMARLLHELGADIHARDKIGQTPIYLASVQGHLEVVKYLLDHGADANVRTSREKIRTLLDAALDRNDWKAIRFLLREGVNIQTDSEGGWTPLYAASSNGHPEVVTCLLKAGADIDTTTESGWTPLCAASDSGHLEMVKCLRENGADVHATTKTNQTPLHLASRRGSQEVVKYLLREGSNIHAATDGGWTPLCVASDNGHLDVVKCLLKAGADIRATTENGWLSLHLASRQNSLEVVKYLLEKGVDVDTATKGGWTPLCVASDNGHLDVVKYLLEAGADVRVTTNNGWTPLFTASRSGYLKVVKYLRENGAEADIHTLTETGQTPLYTASLNGHLEVVKYLLEEGVDVHVPNEGGWTPLCTASCNGHSEVVKYLLDHGADLDIDKATNSGETPLYTASLNGHLEVIKHLYENGANIHTTNENGWTPLCVASKYGYVEVVKYLLEHGAESDVDKPTSTGGTPLYTASLNGHLEVVKYLCENGANVHTTNENGFTPLCVASKYGYVKVAEYLLEHGAKSDIDKAASTGQTPLSSASLKGHPEVTQLLLEAGADINIQGFCGQTPLISSIIGGRKKTSQILIRFGAKVTLVDNYGRTAADWLKLLKTDDELLRKICSDPLTPPETKIEYLNESVASTSAAILGQQVEDSDSLFNDLGHYLLALNDTANACVAYQQQIDTASQEASVEHERVCDVCSAYPIEGSRFICKTCPDTDLCKSCMDKYREGEHFAACHKHEYLEISGLDSDPLSGDSLRAWLRDRVAQYKRSPSFPFQRLL